MTLKGIKMRLKGLFVSIKKSDTVYLCNFLGKKWYIKSSNKLQCIWALDFMKTHIRFPEIVNSDDIIFDIGACTGEYSIPICKKQNFVGKIYAFEAEPLSYLCLVLNTKLYKLENKITPIKIALHNKDNILLEFFADSITTSSGSFHNSYGSKKYVKTITIDSFCKRHRINKINILKITVNGHEPYVLKGAIKMLKNTHYVFAQTKEYKKCKEILFKNQFNLIKEFIENEKEDVRIFLMENKNWKGYHEI